MPVFAGLARCEQCGLVYYPGPLGVAASELYGSDYFTGREYVDYLAERRAHEANFRRRIRALRRWLPEGRSVFEVGCAYGFFLKMAGRYWDTRGCDVAPEAVRYAVEELGVNATNADLSDVSLTKGSVDAFCMWDTVEHVEPLERYMAHMSEVLEPGGLLALTTGDIGSILARKRGERWRQIHPPTHIWYFSVETMHKMLERFGFEPVYTKHVGMTRSIGQLVYRATARSDDEDPWAYRAVNKVGIGPLGVWMNTLDLMMVVGRRRDPRGRRRAHTAADAQDLDTATR